nr:recombinase family protein [Angustibacter sp. Root456]
MTTVKAAAIYARISSDAEGAGLGVGRQVADCEALAERLGWSVAEVYSDNDISAYSGKRRPAYERMLEDLRDGHRDAVIVYHVDRLTRRPIELEQFVAAMDAAKVRHVRFVVGDSDIMTGDGLMAVRMMGAVAAHESATKSRRILRKHAELAEQGRPNGGPLRPFGFEKDRVTVRQDEAAVIRTLVERFLAGESLRSLCVWLDAEGITTVAGGPWRTPTLRNLLRSGRIAGLREHRGEVVGKAVWPQIITPQTRQRTLTRMESQTASGRRAPRRYLLSGLLRCGKCGTRLFSAARQASRRYVCSSGPDHGGCGRLTVVAEPVEQLIADAVLMRLSNPALMQQLAGGTSDEESAALAEQLSDERGRADELAAAYATKAITMAEWLTARDPIQARITDLERRLARVTNTAALDGLTGPLEVVQQRWADLNLDRQAAVVRTLLDHAVIQPVGPGQRTLDPNRVQAHWRV